MSMFSFPALDRFLGRGEAAVTVPPLDGGLKPNNRLEELPPGIPSEAPDCVAVWNGGVIWSSGLKLLTGQGAEMIAFGSEITALAASADRIAVATGEGVRVLDEGLNDVTPALRERVSHVTALAFAPDGALWFTTGSETNPPQEWRRDLMEMNRSGSLGRIDLGSGEVKVVRRRLGWPAGVIVRENGRVAVSEAWRSQIVEFDANGGGGQVLLDEIPGYPGRMAARPGGGVWLCIFAPRSPLFEFVLREPGYRKAMLGQLDPQHWVAPKYSSGEDFREPMQGGALKQMGILKPWAPTLSYGLVVALDEAFVPQASHHSRAGGRRHGITSAVELDGRLILAGRGSDEILTVDLQGKEDAA